MAVLRSLFAFALLVLSGTVTLAQAPTFPNRTIRFIVPFGAGGPTDVIARLVAEKAAAKWGQQVVVENMAGAGGNTGTAAAAKAPADGYTLLVVSTGFIINPSLYSKVPYDLKTTFAPISLFAQTPNIISVHPSVPAKTLKELVDLIKANPGKYSYAQPSTGSPPHLSGERLKMELGLDLATVSHTSAAAAINNTLGGHTPIAITALPAAKPSIQGGTLRGLAVFASAKAPGLPEVPTTAEAGFPDQEADTLTGFVVPAGTPKEIIAQWWSELTRIIKEPDVTKTLEALGFGPVASTPEQFAKRIAEESERWAKVIKEAKIKVD